MAHRGDLNANKDAIPVANRNRGEAWTLAPVGNRTYEGRNAIETYYTYDDANGNIAQSLDAEGIAAYFVYDALDRRIKTSYTGGDYAYFAYDENGNLKRVEDSTWGHTYFTHDELDRITRRETPDARIVEWEYDENSNVTAIAYPAGGGAYYEYDEVDRMMSVTAPSGTDTYYEYDANDNVAKKTLGDGSFTYYAYDEVSRLQSIRAAKADGTPIVYFEFDRDAVGDIISCRRESGDVVYYGYDDVRRLTSDKYRDSSLTLIYGFDWDYDETGNRTYQKKDMGGTVTETYYTHDDANALTRSHELPADEWTYHHYDKNGSMTALQEPAGTTYFTYADHGLTDSIVPPTGDAVYFFYDGRMTRYAMKEGAETTYFLWDEDRLRILELRKGAETRRLTHGYAPVDGIGTIVEEEVVGGEKYYHHLDHRGTTYKVTDSSGAIVWCGQVDAFGVVLSSSGTPPSIFWYQGEAWYRVVSGGRMYYLSPTRIYDLVTGRYLSRDLLARGLNRYLYCFNNPVNAVDPDGAEDRPVVAEVGVAPPPKPKLPPLPKPEEKGGWAFKGFNWAGVGSRGQARMRPVCLFDFAAKIHDLMYHVNGIKIREYQKEPPKRLSRIAKANSIFLEMNNKVLKNLRPEAKGLHEHAKKLFAQHVGALATSREWLHLLFCPNDGFVNILVPGKYPELDDRQKYLMIPYLELPEGRRPLKTISPCRLRAFFGAKRRQEPNYLWPIAYDKKPGWREWASATYGNIWNKAKQITEHTGTDFKW